MKRPIIPFSVCSRKHRSCRNTACRGRQWYGGVIEFRRVERQSDIRCVSVRIQSWK